MTILSHLIALSQLYGPEAITYIGPPSFSVKLYELAGNVITTPGLPVWTKISALARGKHLTGLGVWATNNPMPWKAVLAADLVWVEFTKSADIIRLGKKAGKPVVCFVHNFEYAYYQRSEPARFRLVSGAVQRNERISLEEADVLLCLDKGYIRDAAAWYGLDLTKKTIVELQPFDYREVPSGVAEPKSMAPWPYFALSGSFSFGHNVPSLLRFLEEAWKDFTYRHNDFFLLVCGSGLRSIATRIMGYKNVLISDRPYDERALIGGAVAYINPVVISAGVQIKNLIPLSVGVPLIGLRGTFNGYDLEHQVTGFVADSIPAMVEWLLVVATEVDVRERLREATVNYYRERHSLNAGKKALRMVLEDICPTVLATHE